MAALPQRAWSTDELRHIFTLLGEVIMDNEAFVVILQLM